MKQMAILTDITKCIGCEECVVACKKTNGTGEDRPFRQPLDNDLTKAGQTLRSAAMPALSGASLCIGMPGRRFTKNSRRSSSV